MRFTFGKLSWLSLAVGCGLVAGVFLNGRREDHDALGLAVSKRVPATRESGGRQGTRPRGDSTIALRLNLETQNQLQSLEDLAFRDPAAALAKLAAWQDTDLRSVALAALARGWVKSDPEAAGGWVAALEPEEDGISAALGLIPTWAASSPNDCLAWSTRLVAGDLRDVSLAQLADAWVSTNPQQAVSCYFGLSSEPGSEQGLHVIVAQWALDAPQTAVDYLTRSVELPRREEFLETALVSLANQDPILAWSYTSGISDPERIMNVRAMALESMAETKPGEAIKLAESVGSDPTLLKGIARGWASKDANAATAWIHTLRDPELAKALLDEISHE